MHCTCTRQSTCTCIQWTWTWTLSSQVGRHAPAQGVALHEVVAAGRAGAPRRRCAIGHLTPREEISRRPLARAHERATSRRRAVLSRTEALRRALAKQRRYAGAARALLERASLRRRALRSVERDPALRASALFRRLQAFSACFGGTVLGAPDRARRVVSALEVLLAGAPRKRATCGATRWLLRRSGKVAKVVH